jgi:hypothetical protein
MTEPALPAPDAIWTYDLDDTPVQTLRAVSPDDVPSGDDLAWCVKGAGSVTGR